MIIVIREWRLRLFMVEVEYVVDYDMKFFLVYYFYYFWKRGLFEFISFLWVVWM